MARELAQVLAQVFHIATVAECVLSFKMAPTDKNKRTREHQVGKGKKLDKVKYYKINTAIFNIVILHMGPVPQPPSRDAEATV